MYDLLYFHRDANIFRELKKFAMRTDKPMLHHEQFKMSLYTKQK